MAVRQDATSPDMHRLSDAATMNNRNKQLKDYYKTLIRARKMKVHRCENAS